METAQRGSLVVFFYLALFMVGVLCYDNPSELHSRKARHLVFPSLGGSKFQLISGIGIPIQLPFQAITLGYVFKSDYGVPVNGTMYTRPFEAFAETTSRQNRDVSNSSERWDFYAILEAFVHRALTLGRAAGIPTSNHIDEGRLCVLRAICETATLGFKHDGLLGEIIHVLLTPSSTSDPIRSRRHIDYHAAERLGRAADSTDTCARLFSGCPSGALDFISTLVPLTA